MLPTLIFDLDGTLVDTAPDLLNAANAVLAAKSRPPIDPATLRHMVGFGARSLITQAFTATGAGPAPGDMPALVELFLANYAEHLADRSHPYPGVAETLEQLKQEGAILGVLTNKPHGLAEPLLAKLGLAPYFTAVYGAGAKPYQKPDPRIFADVLKACGGSPGKAVMVGDSVTDLHTARAASVPCILMSYGYTPVPASSLGAELVLDEFTMLPGALGRFRVP